MKYTSALSPGKYLSKQEESSLRELLLKYRKKYLANTTLVLLMLETGCRPREALALTWHDYNLSDRTIFIKTQKRGVDRSIPLRKDKNLINRLKDLGRGEDDARIFTIHYNTLLKFWMQIRPCKKSPHCLRHTFAINLYKGSKDILLTQWGLGHRKLATTSIYLQMYGNADAMRKAIGG